MVYNCINNILSLLYPPHCQLCDAPVNSGLCDGCRDELPSNRYGCHRCGLPLPTAGQPLCGRCLRRPPAVDLSLIPFLYAPPIDRLIGAFKFSGQLTKGRLLSQLLTAHLERQPALPQLLIPVPLHPSRLRQRGFNQALELAKPLGRHFAIPLDRHSCQRIRPTPPQHQLKQRQRRRNIRAAFHIVRPIAADHVALVDDVVTTGSTVNELARCLKRAGVARVDVWALARTP